MSPAQHIQRPPLEGMALTNDRYLLRISSEVVVVGSLSSGSSITSVTLGFSITYRWISGFCNGGFKLDISMMGLCLIVRLEPHKGEYSRPLRKS